MTMVLRLPLSTMSKSPAKPIEVILFTTPQCPHCPSVKQIFQDYKQVHHALDLNIYDLTQQPEQANLYQVRSVPWFKIGDFEFQGLHTASEINYWIEHAHDDAAVIRYLIDNLNDGQLNQVEKLIRQHPDWLLIAINLLANMDAPMQARIGLGALLEGMQNDPILEPLLPKLTEFSKHKDHSIRGDACHYLGLINTPKSRAALTDCLTDENIDVREIAQDSLAELAALD